MRIKATASASVSGRAKSSGAAQAKAGFAPTQHRAVQAAAPKAVAAASPVVSVDALIALQEGDDFRRARKAARQRADDLLGIMERVRLGLLEGAIPLALLHRLSATLHSARADSGDVHLESILNAVEVRAAVEMAKLDSGSGGVFTEKL